MNLKIKRSKIVWILNLSPDSFSDWKKYNKKELIERIQYLIDSWSDIIDVWAESTAPWSIAISSDEELFRLELFFKIIWEYIWKVEFSLDTMKSWVAKKGIKLWVTYINDVSWWRFDDEMFNLIAHSWVKYVLMYCLNSSWRAGSFNWSLSQKRLDIINIIFNFFEERIGVAEQYWIKKSQIILDPWMWAFVSSDYRDSVEVLRWIKKIKEKFKLPIFIWTSRKGFLWNISKDSWPQDRIWSSLASSLYALNQWVEYIRLHDVKELMQFLEVWFHLNEK